VRTRWILVASLGLLGGMLGGALMAPQPASGVSKEMVQLQEQVAQLLQQQQDLRSAFDQKNAELRLLVEQSLDATNKVNGTMGDLQKGVQDVAANSGSRMDALTTQAQSISDNLQVVQERVGKLSSQMTDMQNTLQSIDGKLSGAPAAAPVPTGDSSGVPAPAAGSDQPAGAGGGGSAPAASADVLYTSALRDFTGGKYDLAKQEFSEYMQDFSDTDLASNAQFYLGEIEFAQGDFKGAITQYDRVLANYPKSYKTAAARLKKGEALAELGQKASAIKEYKEVIRLFPGTEEARRAQARMKQLGVKSTAAPAGLQ
jgi:tol-pal system protein YbgF